MARAGDERQRVAGAIERGERRRRQRLDVERRHAPQPANGLPRALEVEAVEAAGRAPTVAREDDRAARDPCARLAAPAPGERGEAMMAAAREVVEVRSQRRGPP